MTTKKIFFSSRDFEARAEPHLQTRLTDVACMEFYSISI